MPRKTGILRIVPFLLPVQTINKLLQRRKALRAHCVLHFAGVSLSRILINAELYQKVPEHQVLFVYAFGYSLALGIRCTS